MVPELEALSTEDIKRYEKKMLTQTFFEALGFIHVELGYTQYTALQWVKSLVNDDPASPLARSYYCYGKIAEDQDIFSVQIVPSDF